MIQILVMALVMNFDISISLNISGTNNDCFEYGIDYIGFDLDDGHYVSTDGALACQLKCQETSDCIFWTWDPYYHSACWRKWGKGETRVDETLISGPKDCGQVTTIKPNLDVIRTMSYNMFGWNALHDPWKTENLYRTIKEFEPDLLGAQEVGEFSYQVAENIGNDYVVASHGGSSAGHAILYRSSIFNLISAGYENIAEHDKYGQRTVEYAQFIHKPSGRLIDHFNTHFCICDETGTCCGPEPLLNSARTVEDAMERYRRPGSLIILTGDLNVFGGYENHSAIKYLKGELDGEKPPFILEDTFREVNDASVDGTTFPNKGKIDYVFANQGTEIQSANIDRNWYGDASDHWPINAVIKVY